MVFLKLIRYTVERQILVVFGVVNVLDGFEDLRSEITLVDVIILGGNMHYKLDAPSLGALGHSLDLLYVDLSLDLVLLDVVQGPIRKEQDSALSLHPSIDLDDDA